MDYDTPRQASKALGIPLTTMLRWVKVGWLMWPKGGTVSDAHLMALRSYINETRYDVMRDAAIARTKYHTEDEVTHGKYMSVQRYRERNRSKVNETDSARKALSRHPYFQEMKAELLEFYGKKCLACQRAHWTCLDHIKPLPQGENHPCNLQPLCRACNTTKRDKDTDYRPDKGRWLAIRWGGWTVNGQRSGQRRIATGPRTLKEWVWNPESGRMEKRGGELGSPRHGKWLSVHERSIIEWRNARIHAGSMLSVERYKSFGIQGPPIHTDGMTDIEHCKSIA